MFVHWTGLPQIFYLCRTVVPVESLVQNACDWWSCPKGGSPPRSVSSLRYHRIALLVRRYEASQVLQSSSLPWPFKNCSTRVNQGSDPPCRFRLGIPIFEILAWRCLSWSPSWELVSLSCWTPVLSVLASFLLLKVVDVCLNLLELEVQLGVLQEILHVIKYDENPSQRMQSQGSDRLIPNCHMLSSWEGSRARW